MEAGRLSNKLSNGGISNGTTSTVSIGTRRDAVAGATQGHFGPLVSLTAEDYVKLLVCSGCGLVFGVAAEKARGIYLHLVYLAMQQHPLSCNVLTLRDVYSCLLFTVHVPSVIQQQMLFGQNSMLKVFLMAVTSCELPSCYSDWTMSFNVFFRSCCYVFNSVFVALNSCTLSSGWQFL